nr:immunoglobulin light chain junction region [Macaca mulatta]
DYYCGAWDSSLDYIF